MTEDTAVIKDRQCLETEGEEGSDLARQVFNPSI